jgi:hypothetical protein
MDGKTAILPQRIRPKNRFLLIYSLQHLPGNGEKRHSQHDHAKQAFCCKKELGIPDAGKETHLAGRFIQRPGRETAWKQADFQSLAERPFSIAPEWKTWLLEILIHCPLMQLL